MKQRVTALDLQILTPELQRELTDYRLQNIYNISTSNKQYLLKFAQPDSKKNLVLDSGFKAHITEFTRSIPEQPSNFVAKLRKHLKTRRLSSIKQIGIDRVLVLSFSDGLYHLVLEFFSAGNIVLLDDQRKIMALQRLVEEKGNNDKYAVGETYNLFDESLFEEDESKDLQAEIQFDAQEIQNWITEKKNIPQQPGKKAKVLSIQKILYQKFPFLSADLIGKNLVEAGINSSTASVDFETDASVIVEVLKKTQEDVKELTNRSKVVTGYILTKKNPLFDPSKDSEDLQFIYDQFHPFPPVLKDEEQLIEVKGYNKTLDKFFSTIESSKYALRIQSQETQAKKRLEAARDEKHQQVQRLIDVQEVNKLKGETIIFNADLVEEAKSAVQSLLDQSMDWKTMEKLIGMEKQKGNPVAKVINVPLNLLENKISLSLSTEMDYADEDEEGSENESESDSDSDSDSDTPSVPKVKPSKVKNTINVTIDLGISAYANASNYFTVKKSTVEKQKKVEQSSSKALKNIEQRIERDLKKNLKQEVEVLRKLRTPYFFEKFNWFLSNEGYLILAGKDDSQTDMIYHRYSQPDDVYVHADVDGASHVFILNPNKGEVSPSALMQAGIFSLSTSKAWDNKSTTSAWWSYVGDVSKKDFDGSILKAGSFRYLKEKKFLPPSQLVMGFAFVWKIKTEKNQKRLEEQLEELENLDINDIKAHTEEPENEADVEPVKEQDPAESQTEEPTRDSTPGSEQKPEPEHEPEHEPETEPEQDLDTMSYAPTTATQKSKSKSVRGKKGKMRKIAEKYADQDEEERTLRMEALGTLKQNAKKEEELKKQQLQKIQHIKKIEKRKRIEELTANKYSDNKETINLDEILDELVPTIAKEDEILECIPMMAPWQALNKYRYRVKVQPGTMKKGKAITDILMHLKSRPVDETEFDRMYDFPREHEVLAGLKQTELLPSLYVSKVKLMLPDNKGKDGSGKNSNAGKGGKKKK